MLGRLRAVGIDAWVEGGWGVDALLGERTRAQDDLDLGVRFEDVEHICAALSEFGRSNEEWSASFVLCDGKGRKIDCHPLQFDEHGACGGLDCAGRDGGPDAEPGRRGAGRIAFITRTCGASTPFRVWAP